MSPCGSRTDIPDNPLAYIVLIPRGRSMACTVLVLAVTTSHLTGVGVEAAPAEPMLEGPAFEAKPVAERIHLDLHDEQRFTVTCATPDAEGHANIAWRAASLVTGKDMISHSPSEGAAMHGVWDLTFVTTGAHVVEAVCYDPASGWTEQAEWIVDVGPGAQRGAF